MMECTRCHHVLWDELVEDEQGNPYHIDCYNPDEELDNPMDLEPSVLRPEWEK